MFAATADDRPVLAGCHTGRCASRRGAGEIALKLPSRRRLALGLSPTPSPGLILLLFGMALGPMGIGLLSEPVLAALDPAVSVALAALGVFVGLDLKLRRPREDRLLAAASLEAGATILVVAGGVLLVHSLSPSSSLGNPWLFAVMLGLCASSSSTPAEASTEARQSAALADRRSGRCVCRSCWEHSRWRGHARERPAPALGPYAGGCDRADDRRGGLAAGCADVVRQRAAGVRDRRAAAARRHRGAPVVVGAVCRLPRRRVLERGRSSCARRAGARHAVSAASADGPAADRRGIPRDVLRGRGRARDRVRGSQNSRQAGWRLARRRGGGA